MRPPLLAALAAVLPAVLPAVAGGQPLVSSPVPPAQRLPAVRLLPEGSTLNDVMLPRYDTQRRLKSVLRSPEMRITDASTIEADAVSIDVYRPDGGRRGRVELGQAVYRQNRETVTARKTVRIASDDLDARGSGAEFHIPTNRGFLLGPVDCRIHVPLHPTAMTRPPAPRRPATLAAALAAALQLPLAAAPVPLTAAELAALDRAAAPAGGDLAPLQDDVGRLTTTAAAAAAQADTLLADFVQVVGLTGVLAQPALAAAEPPKVDAGPDDTVVQCDGGLFFDGDLGVLVYLKNIRLTNPEFDLNCRDQLKIFLEPEASQPDKPAATEEKPAATEDKPAATEDKSANAGNDQPAAADQLFGGGRFGDVRQIVATGAVRVTRKDPQGKPVTATAETAIYDAASGDVILRDGFPSLVQGRNALVAKEPGLYIRFYKNGNVFTQPGKWVTVAADLRNQRALRPKP